MSDDQGLSRLHHAWQSRRDRGGADAATPAPSDEARLLTEIRDLLERERAPGV
jgi:hypothetical protein